MPNSPAFQFYAADYLADENVSVMTLEEEGAYWRAIAYCWREGSIPADDGRLSRLLKGATNQTLTVVRNCFNQMATDPTRLIHPRLEIERKKQAEWRVKSSEAGKKSGKSRRDKKFSTEPTFDSGSTKCEPNANQTGTLLLQSSSSLSTTAAKRGSRIPVEFVVTDIHREFARKHGFVNPDELIDNFMDHWRAKAGKDGVKLDWDAAFRTWMRNSINFVQKGASNGYVKESPQRAAARKAIAELDSEQVERFGSGSAGQRLF